jgi:hypothetical protein
MILLGLSELKNYFSVQTHSDIFVSTSHRQDTFHANIDITFPKIPCDIIGLNFRDQLNNAVNDYYGELHKHRISSDGEDLGIESWGEKNAPRNEIAERSLREFRDH